MTGIERRIFLALFLFSLLVRIAMVALNPPETSTTLTPLNDSTDYHHLALSIPDVSPEHKSYPGD